MKWIKRCNVFKNDYFMFNINYNGSKIFDNQQEYHPRGLLSGRHCKIRTDACSDSLSVSLVRGSTCGRLQILLLEAVLKSCHCFHQLRWRLVDQYPPNSPQATRTFVGAHFPQ